MRTFDEPQAQYAKMLIVCLMVQTFAREISNIRSANSSVLILSTFAPNNTQLLLNSSGLTKQLKFDFTGTTEVEGTIEHFVIYSRNSRIHRVSVNSLPHHQCQSSCRDRYILSSYVESSEKQSFKLQTLMKSYII